MYIPAILSSFYGEALCEKMPLLRAMKALDREARRLLAHLGGPANIKKMYPQIGLEQEFFQVPRSTTSDAPTCSSAAAPNEKALACLREIQHECFKLGIPMQTRHREVAPNQYEIAPFHGIATAQIDNNLVVLQIIDEVAARHGLAALVVEKPLKGVNGSGKHNNFSIASDTSLNIFSAPEMAKACKNPEAFATSPCLASSRPSTSTAT